MRLRVHVLRIMHVTRVHICRLHIYRVYTLKGNLRYRYTHNI